MKKGKKKHYEIVLEDTILFAEGGGQPCDHGVLRVIPSDVNDIEKLSLNKLVKFHTIILFLDFLTSSCLCPLLSPIEY